MKKILLLLSLVFVFSISCEDDIIEKPKEIEVQEIGGESINFDDIDTYELGDLVDLQIDIVLPAGSKVVASDFEVSTFVSDAAQVINSEAGYVVMAENADGETMLLGYALPPAEVKKSLETKSRLVKTKATYKNSEISCRSTMLSLVMMSLGKLEGIPSADAIEKIFAHAEFNQLVAKFTDKFNNDPVFLEKINEDKEIKDQIKKIAKEVLDQCITEIISTTKSKSTTKSSGLIQNFNGWSAWDKYEPWTWHGEANWYNVYDAPFLAICEKSNVPLKEKLAIANPANINFIADFYDESGKFQDYRFIGRNSTLIQKAIHSGASQTTVLTDVDFVDGFDQNKTYKVVIKKCLGKNFDEGRYWIVRGAHILRVGESIMNIVADGELFNVATTAITNKDVAIGVVKSLKSILNSVNLADLSSPGNVTSIFETAVTMLGSKVISQMLSEKAVKLAGKASVKIAGKASNPTGWAVMIFDAVNDFIPMSVSMAATPETVEYTFNLAQNKIYDNNAPTISITNISPNNGQTKVDNPTTFKWDGSAKEYQLLMWATDDPYDIIHFPKSADKTQTVNNLDFGKNYKWQVTAYGDDDYNVKGDVWEFTMANGENQKPTKPVAMYPLGLSEDIPTSMRFEWTKSTDPNPKDLLQYKLEYFYEKDGEVAEKFEKIIEETHYDAKLKAGQTYYWNVVAIDDRGAKAEGNHYAFTTIPNTAPSAPVLISPTDNSTDLNTTVEFSWNASSDVDEDNLSYEITVQTGDEIKLATTLNTNFSFTLATNTSYTWYVTANDNNGGKTKSEVLSFTTVLESSINTELSDDFNDGDFTNSPQWDLWNNDDHPGKAAVQSGYVQFERTGAGGNGGGVHLEKELDINVTSNTNIEFDVNPMFSDVGSGAGWSDTEYPIYVQLYLENTSGEEKILRIAYNYRGGQSKNYNNVTQIAFPNCTQDEWKRDEVFTIKEHVSNAQKITKIRIGGNGWNYKGAIDNISITETSQFFNLSENFEGTNLDERITIKKTGNFNSSPGVKSRTELGSQKAFGFGKSSCGASCFDSYQTQFIVNTNASYVDEIRFNVMELDGNWGSSSRIYIDGKLLTGHQLSNSPGNDHSGDTTPREIIIPVGKVISEFKIVVTDITRSSEIFIDDLIIE
jgi:hypothetical protein